MTNIKLGDLCKSCAGQIKVEDGELIDYIDISSIDNEKKKLIGFQTMPFGESPSRARKVVKKGSILVSTVRPNLNAIAVLENDTPNISVASTGFCILDCKDDVDNRFVFNFCKSRKFIDDMVSKATGASYPAVSDKIIRSALVPNYTYEEQCNISKVLDSISDIIDKREAELFSLDELIKARFVEMFGEKYPEDTLFNLCNIIDYRGKTPEKVECGLPFITAKNIKMHHMTLEPREYISKETYDKVMVRGFPKEGDVVFTTEAPLGNVCRIPHFETEFYIGQRIVTMQTDALNPTYLEYALSDEEFVRKYMGKSSGSTVTGIRVRLLEQLTIPIPPRTLQDEFSIFVDQVDKSKVAVQKALDETQLLFDSLMQKYFG